MENKPQPLALTMGDPSGIGPEIILKSLTVLKNNNYLVLGDPLIFESAIERFGIPFELNKIKTASEANFKSDILNLLITSKLTKNPNFGVTSAESGKASFSAIVEAIKLAKLKKISGIVTAPINKKSLNLARLNFPGHTEILSKYSGSEKVAMMLLNKDIKTVLVTLHCPLTEVMQRISVQKEFEAIELAYKGAQMLGIKNPIIAVAALNPHAGEEGLFGTEEKEIIKPAIKLAVEKGIDVRGPFPGDTVFMNAKMGKYDIVVAQYHDQGLIPIKFNGIEDGVNITIGLDFIRTSPDHGTAFDIAGKGIASAESFISALTLAQRLSFQSGTNPTNT